MRAFLTAAFLLVVGCGELEHYEPIPVTDCWLTVENGLGNATKIEEVYAAPAGSADGWWFAAMNQIPASTLTAGSYVCWPAREGLYWVVAIDGNGQWFSNQDMECVAGEETRWIVTWPSP